LFDHDELSSLINESRRSTQKFEAIKSYFEKYVFRSYFNSVRFRWELKLQRDRDEMQELSLKLEEERRQLQTQRDQLGRQ